MRPQEPVEPALPPDEDAPQRIVGPTEGAPTMSLAAAVRLALERNFALLDSIDAVQAWRPWGPRDRRAKGALVGAGGRDRAAARGSATGAGAA